MAIEVVSLSRSALGIGLALAMLVGCGGAQRAGTTSVMPHGAASGQQLRHSRSWMMPEPKGEDLVYVSNRRNTVRVFNYPKGKQVGILDVGYPRASCSDTHGNVYISSGPELFEYAHGGTAPINTLSIDYSGYVIACAVDPTTGNVAATVSYGTLDYYVAIFFAGRGSSENLVDSGLREYGACVYDDTGNLYVMGETGVGDARLTELLVGSGSFFTLSLSKALLEGALQWDGRYLDIDNFDKGSELIYQVEVSGSNATVVSSTQLLGNVSQVQPWLFGKTFVAVIGAGKRRKIAFWAYPAGGKPTKTIPVEQFPQKVPIAAITVSVAASGSHIRQ